MEWLERYAELKYRLMIVSLAIGGISVVARIVYVVGSVIRDVYVETKRERDRARDKK
ncbi:MAG: hypothetical protein LBB86_06990 [Oscillospiraceae bacterium]|jgi:hypothetical protein|nr:hypothetical protein [Oscillospiraceae bacterium]